MLSSDSTRFPDLTPLHSVPPSSPLKSYGQVMALWLQLGKATKHCQHNVGIPNEHDAGWEVLLMSLDAHVVGAASISYRFGMLWHRQVP